MARGPLGLIERGSQVATPINCQPGLLVRGPHVTHDLQVTPNQGFQGTVLNCANALITPFSKTFYTSARP